MCASCRRHFHSNCVTSTHLQADKRHQLENCPCRFCNSRPDLVPNNPGAEPRLNKQHQGSRQHQLVILQWNANGILREVAALETVLASLQVNVACSQESKLLPKDKTTEIPQHRAVHRGGQIHGETRGGCLTIYVHATLAFSAIYPASGMSNVLEKLSVVIPLPGQQIFPVNNWYLLPETTNFPQRADFSDLKHNSNADFNVHDPLLDPVARPTERGEFIGEKMLDANGAFLNTGAPTRQDPSTGSFSSPDVTVVHKSIQELCYLSPCDSIF